MTGDTNFFDGSLASYTASAWGSLAAQPFTVDTAAELEAQPLVGSGTPQGKSPAQVRSVYGFDQIEFVDAVGNTIIGDGFGQTIAIVNAFHTPNAQSDLAAFSTFYGLPVLNQPGNGTFTQVKQNGAAPGGATNGGWALETALDVQWAHALAPGANILLVEANSASLPDLLTAVDYARNVPGVSVVSMSWGVAEFLGESGNDFHFTTPTNHQGVAFVAAAGNSGGPGMYPAYSRNVLATGGTRLDPLTGAETAWGSPGGSSGTGGGISQFQAQPSWQNGVVTQTNTMRAMPDVAFLADPTTGVAVYDTFNMSPGTPWRVTSLGGTSLAAPSWAALVAVANQGRALVNLPTLDMTDLMTRLYSMPTSNFNDITEGTGGGAIPQTAAVGFDLVSGLGSPRAHLITAAMTDSASVSGTVFHDFDGNAAQNGEPGLANWRVYADLNGNAAFDAPALTQHTSTDVPKSIPAFGMVTSNRSVAGLAGNIIDVNVTINLTHTRTGDLILTLIAPDGTEIVLARQQGGAGDHYLNTVFDDSAAVGIDAGVASFSGAYHPVEPLLQLFGKSPNGLWQLRIEDVVAGTSGTLNSWSLSITSGDPNALSGADGDYSIGGLRPGSYNIRQVPQLGATLTTPAGGAHAVNLIAGQAAQNLNFGNQIPPSGAPSGVTLLAASDSGVSNSDGITNRNNAHAGATLQFQITGTLEGATVTIYADGVAIGSALAFGSSTIVTTNGTTALLDGVRVITARQAEFGKPQSGDSPGTPITIDTVAPTAAFVPVTPNPRTAPVPSVELQFSEEVAGVALGQFQFTRDGGANLLGGAQSVASGDGQTWSLADLTSLTGGAGEYAANFDPAGFVVDLAGNAVAGLAQTTFTNNAPFSSTAIGRKLFYNQSKFDGNNAAANASDDGAVAPDKTAYLPGGGTATFDNISSYTRGINGIIIDLAGTHGALTAGDFIFKVGSNNTPGTWTAGPAPASITVRPGEGVSGSDRVTIIWGANAAKNTWLQVILKGNDAAGGFSTNTGLATSDIFFFGSRIGDTGSGTTTAAQTTAADEIATRNNTGAGATITNIFDHDRSGTVVGGDAIASRNNTGAMVKINIAGPPAAPEASPAVSTGDGATRARAMLAAWAGWLRHQSNEDPLADALDEPLIHLLARARSLRGR